MAGDAAHDAGEEELRTGSSRRTARIILLMAVVLVAALVFLVVRHHRGSPTGRPAASASPTSASTAAHARTAAPRTAAPRTAAPRTAAPRTSGAGAALVAGSGSGFSLVHARIVYAAELVNTTKATLRVAYPIRLPGASPSTARVTLAALTARTEPYSPGLRPPALTHIAAHQRVTLQIGLRLRCPPLPPQRTWPTGSSTIPIQLAGSRTPIVFTFAGLFGFHIRADVRRACGLAAG